MCFVRQKLPNVRKPFSGQKSLRQRSSTTSASSLAQSGAGASEASRPFGARRLRRSSPVKEPAESEASPCSIPAAQPDFPSSEDREEEVGTAEQEVPDLKAKDLVETDLLDVTWQMDVHGV